MIKNLVLFIVCCVFSFLAVGSHFGSSKIIFFIGGIRDYGLWQGAVFAILGIFFIYEIFKKPLVGTNDSLSSQIQENVMNQNDLVIFISMLQEKGRLLDFVMDDISSYSDEEVGRVARVVHQGVKEVIDSTTTMMPIYEGLEGEKIEIKESENFSKYKLLGSGIQKPPFSGVVVHRGWKAGKIKLPKSSLPIVLNNTDNIIKPAEIEV